MIKTGTFLDLDVQSLGQRTGEAWHWWIDELAGMLPRRLSQQRQSIRGIVAHWQRGKGLTIDGGATVSPIDEAAPATILLDPALVLTRTVDLPAMRQADAKRLVALDIDRLTPFARDAAFSDAVVAGPGVAPGTVATEVAVIGKALAQDIRVAAAEANLAPVAVGVAEPDQNTLRFDFAPQMRADGLLPAIRSGRTFWWTLAAALFAFNLGLYVYRDIASTQRLRDLVEQQKLAATSARRLASSIEREDRIRRWTIARRDRGSPLLILATTAHAVPAGAWLQRFTWSDGSLRLSGYKQPDLDLPKALRASGLLRRVRTATSDAAAGSTDGQPFDVTAEVAPPT